MAVKGGLVSVNYRVVAVIMRDEEGEDLPVELVFTLHKSEEFNNTSYRQGHVVSILSVRNIKCRGAALDLARKKQEVHIVCT